MLLGLYHICIFILVFSVFISISAASSTLPVPHTQSAVSLPNNSAWDYTVSVTGETGPTGIMEKIPPGFTYQSSDIPEDQVRMTDTGVIFSLPDGGNLTFTITGSHTTDGLLTGSYTDLLTGKAVPISPLFLSDGTIAVREPDQSVPSEPGQRKTESPGFGWIITTLTLLSLAGSIVYRRRI